VILTSQRDQPFGLALLNTEKIFPMIIQILGGAQGAMAGLACQLEPLVDNMVAMARISSIYKLTVAGIIREVCPPVSQTEHGTSRSCNRLEMGLEAPFL